LEQEMTNPNLFSCPDCNHECSFAALSCPNCGRPFPRTSSSPESNIFDTIHSYILNESSLKVGVCLTLLGLIRVVEGVKQVSHFLDELLAVAAFGFLASSFFSYFALKETQAGRKRWLGIMGDRVFVASVCGLAIICIVVVLEAA
jgi:hypothetical protein